MIWSFLDIRLYFPMGKIKSNQFGFSMVQVMIAAAMMGGLSLVVLELNKSMSRTSRRARVNGELNDVIVHMREMLASTSNCSETFLGQTPFDSGVNDIAKDDSIQFQLSDGTFKNKYQIGSALGGGVKVKSYELVEILPHTSVLDEGTTNLFVRFDIGRGLEITRRIIISVGLNKDKDKIAVCKAMTGRTLMTSYNSLPPNASAGYCYTSNWRILPNHSFRGAIAPGKLVEVDPGKYDCACEDNWALVQTGTGYKNIPFDVIYSACYKR
jgi:Tfp pilus assembly protein PilE